VALGFEREVTVKSTNDDGDEEEEEECKFTIIAPIKIVRRIARAGNTASRQRCFPGLLKLRILHLKKTSESVVNQKTSIVKILSCNVNHIM
jgi:hypothetical protein